MISACSADLETIQVKINNYLRLKTTEKAIYIIILVYAGFRPSMTKEKEFSASLEYQ